MVAHEVDEESARGQVMSVGVGVFYFEETELEREPDNERTSES